MSNLIQCSNGHMYDSQQSPICPHCRPGAGAGYQGTASSDPLGSGSTGNPMGQNTSSLGQGTRTTPGLSDAGGQTGAFSSQRTQAYGSQDLADYKASSPGGLQSASTTAGFIIQTGEKKEIFNPVVGWLVCIEGKDKGKDFRLIAGKNTIGRDKDQQAYISGDDQISRSHATIYYYIQVNIFYIEDHSTHGTFLNNLPVIQRTEVHNMDTIVIGKSKFILRPLCDNVFNWDEFTK